MDFESLILTFYVEKYHLEDPYWICNLYCYDPDADHAPD